MGNVERLREITGVGSAEYEVDGVTHWTDVQLQAVIDRHTTEVEGGTDIVELDRAAADVLDAWAARLALSYDVTMDGQSLKRSQMAAQVEARAARLKGRVSGADGIHSVPTIAPL